jgi:hypothetical protein
VITLVLYSIKDTKIVTNEAGEQHIEKIQETKTLSLDTLVENIQANKYEKIKIVNETLVEGFLAYTGATESLPSLTLQKNIPLKTYVIESSEKLYSTKLEDLGISLTGDIEVIVETKSENTLARIFIDQILPTLFFFVAIIFFFKMFGPK